jgi:hypothetical protein
MSSIRTQQWVVAGMPACDQTALGFGVVVSAYGAVNLAAATAHNGVKPFGTRTRFTVPAGKSAPPPS